MRKQHLLILLFSFFILSISATDVGAQNTTSPLAASDFDKAVELYKSANYIAAERIFQDLLETTETDDPVRYDLDYYRLMCLVKQNKNTADSEITDYLNMVNSSPWQNQLWFELAKLQFTKKRYPVAARSFQNVEKRLLSKADQEDYAFYMGYSNFEAGNLKAASQAFFEVKKSNSIYAPSATYYWGYINYLQGNYETALDEFSKLEHNRQFSGFIKYYTTQIYYIQEKYEKVVEYGEKLIGGAPAEQKNELLKIVGDAFYETNRFASAIKYLDAYKGVNGKKTPEDYYRLGYCYYQIKDYKNAISAFEKATYKKDKMAQNAFYHLADCQLQLGDKNKARAAFQEASKYDFDPKIEEDALFNFAKLTYELSYSPFNETIKAFDQYIAKYPDSERNDAAFDYLVKVYMTTRNYRDAISSIEKIKNQSPSIKEALQRLTYFRALELMNDGNYGEALKYFKRSLDQSRYNRTYKAQSYYWTGDIYYRLGKYMQAIDYFTKFQSSPGAFSLPEFTTAYYNIGYCYFNRQQYDEAAKWFRKYVGQSNANQKMEADASNRIGDYYYLNRKYGDAIENYHKAQELNSYDPDYALYQEAICYGLERKYREKIDILKQLEQRYPRSSFIDDAYYEIARTYERMGSIQEAINGYNRLISDLAQSNYTPKAYLQLGLIYYNQSNYNASLENYKKVVEKFQNSQEAKAALVGIKNNYVDMNNIDGYFAYTNTLGNLVSMTATEQDSIFYMAAEKNYMDGDASAQSQLEAYLNRFPDGSFKVNAMFYLAEIYYQKGDYSKALEYYNDVVDRPDHVFTEQALIKAAELNFNAKKYKLSLEHFIRLERIASSKWNLIKGRLGIMRCDYELNKYAETVKAAITLLATENVTDVMIREANYKMAKSYYMLSQDDEALKYFRLLADDTQSAEGAEAKFFVAQILFNKGNYDDCENEIMDFISKSTPHQYWLAKSFLLLSDVYLKKNDTFQAKHTLSSVVDNYTNPSDGIIDEAKAKIKKLEAIERETIITDEASDSTEIN